MLHTLVITVCLSLPYNNCLTRSVPVANFTNADECSFAATKFANQYKVAAECKATPTILPPKRKAHR